VLVTSRNPVWGEVAARVEVDVLTPAEAVALVRRRIGRLDEATAGALAEERRR
jgi:hypothetical protein